MLLGDATQRLRSRAESAPTSSANWPKRPLSCLLCAPPAESALAAWLQAQAAAGWTLVGLEQTAESVQLQVAEEGRKHRPDRPTCQAGLAAPGSRSQHLRLLFHLQRVTPRPSESQSGNTCRAHRSGDAPLAPASARHCAWADHQPPSHASPHSAPTCRTFPSRSAPCWCWGGRRRGSRRTSWPSCTPPWRFPRWALAGPQVARGLVKGLTHSLGLRRHAAPTLQAWAGCLPGLPAGFLPAQAPEHTRMHHPLPALPASTAVAPAVGTDPLAQCPRQRRYLHVGADPAAARGWQCRWQCRWRDSRASAASASTITAPTPAALPSAWLLRAAAVHIIYKLCSWQTCTMKHSRAWQAKNNRAGRQGEQCCESME